MKAILGFAAGVATAIVAFYAIAPRPTFTSNAQGWKVQYSMPVCPDGSNRYTSIPDRDESDTFTLYCEKPQLKIRVGGTDENPIFRTETAMEASERVRQE